MNMKRLLAKAMVGVAVLLGPLLIPASQANAEVIPDQGRHCVDGPNVSRCAWINWDTDGFVRAYASALDTTSGDDLVGANTVLQVWAPLTREWLTIGGGDWAWGNNGATARSDLISCDGQLSVRSAGKWNWNGTAGPITSHAVLINC